MTEGQCKVDSLSAFLKEVFLNNFHKENNAKFVPFAGYSMPINYDQGIIKEHLHVRNFAGIFDVSHMGQVLITISETNIFNLEKFIPLKLNKLNDNKCYYTFLLNANGGVIDDIILSKINLQGKKYFLIVYNSGRKEFDEKIFKTHLSNFHFLTLKISFGNYHDKFCQIYLKRVLLFLWLPIPCHL